MLERRVKRRGKNILLVGFGPDSIQTIKNPLESAGYNVTTATTAKEALNFAAKGDVNLAIVNNETPEMTGVSFAGVMKAAKATNNIPIAIVTSSYSEKTREEGFLAGVIGFLHCPFTEVEALEFVDSLFISGKTSHLPETPKILAVEDSVLICKMYQAILTKFGYAHKVVQDPLKALDAIREFKPQVILMDANMPGIDGFELTRKIKSDRELESIRIIMVTADTKKQSAVKALDYGAVDFLTKPFDEETLLARMRTHINSKRLFDDLARAYHELRSLNSRLEMLSITDGLTGLFNHRFFHDELMEEMERAVQTEKPLSLALFDIDHFKKFNDTHGHKAGDAVLQAVGAEVKKTIRAEDTAARYGGEEFAVIMPDTSLENAVLAAERLRAAVESARCDYDGASLSVTISVGVAVWDGSLSDHRLIELADKALYESKKNGRNRVTKA